MNHWSRYELVWWDCKSPCQSLCKVKSKDTIWMWKCDFIFHCDKSGVNTMLAFLHFDNRNQSIVCFDYEEYINISVTPEMFDIMSFCYEKGLLCKIFSVFSYGHITTYVNFFIICTLRSVFRAIFCLRPMALICITISVNELLLTLLSINHIWPQCSHP